ncbi:MAG: cob(I)yrinic acid a,c-diamide adenosyltransferase [Alphaproteobacteria bacterium]|nr:cob(I)yrinic acid a,c-diamide adenosyltransferase [Alphaproteobacteria bacterium]
MTETPEQRAHRERMQQRKAEQDAEVRSKTVRRGVVVVNTGDGKGKSTAAFGVALRAAGHGQRVAVVQFIKGKWKTGEQAAIQRFPEIDHVISGDGFTWETQDREQDIASAERGWGIAKGFIQGGAHDVVILDELNLALKYGYLEVGEVVAALEGKPEHVSILVTGRDAPPEILAVADTVTEMRLVKHAYQAGIRARKGVEF